MATPLWVSIETPCPRLSRLSRLAALAALRRCISAGYQPEDLYLRHPELRCVFRGVLSGCDAISKPSRSVAEVNGNAHHV